MEIVAAPTRTEIAWRPLAAVAAGVAALLLLVAGRYGYHRDELYFVRAGAEPAFGYPDQPPLAPLLAHALDAVTGGSLVGLRVPSALAAGLVALLTGVLARELGGRRGAQVLAAGCVAVSAVLLIVGHTLSTTTLDLLVWTSLSLLLVRALRDGGRVWLLVGLVAGIGLQNKTLVALLLFGVLTGVLVAGPRTALRSPWPWVGALLALLIWAPYLLWQANAGWPQLELSAGVAAGRSGSSQPWYLFLPFQLVLVSPLLVPVWAVGWWRLARDPALVRWRAFAVAYAVLALLFVGTGGKPYYLAGLYPVLLAAGAPAVLEWARRTRGRTVALGAALVLSLAVDAVLMLPLVPVTALAATPIVDVNYDAGETVGWPRLVDAVTAARASVPADERVAVLARNYGEAGAVDRFLPALAPAYSGHASYWAWGPPPEDATTVLVIGYAERDVRAWFGDVRLAARVDNGVGLDNDEQGAPVWVARDRLQPWTELWPQLRRVI